jgi:hypothetical protein
MDNFDTLKTVLFFVAKKTNLISAQINKDWIGHTFESVISQGGHVNGNSVINYFQKVCQ